MRSVKKLLTLFNAFPDTAEKEAKRKVDDET